MGRLLSRLVPVFLLLFATGACSGTNLGNINEDVDSREQMPGPGIFDKDGEPAFSWSTDKKAPEASASAAPASSSQLASSTTATSSAASTASTTATSSSSATLSQEQAEFEQFKAWNKLRTTGADSAEYREFRQWLEYQKFKSGQ